MVSAFRLARWSAWLVLGLILGATSRLEAQKWVDSRYPYISSGANDFPMLAVRWVWTRPVEDYFSPYAYMGNLSLDGGISFRGSYFLTALFNAPDLKPGWRLQAFAGITRESRFGFFGVGNDTKFDKDLVRDNQPFFYRVRRERQRIQAEVTRRITGKLHVAGALGLENSKLTQLPGPSVFRSNNPGKLEDTDLTTRVSLIFDARDNEYNTTRGLIVEAGVLRGSAGADYGRIYGEIRGFVPVREGTVIAARLAGAGTTGDPPLHARFELPMWERTIAVLGGEDTHRGYDSGRFAGERVLFGNLEIRHNILDLATIGAISAIAFVDAGRVFEGEAFRLTTEGLHVGGGGGLAIRILRSNIFTFNVAKNEEGWNFSMNTGWMF
ncbi:MAG: BamA/TamA family outer membrane protein [Gemmatimonadota bacterium]